MRPMLEVYDSTIGSPAHPAKVYTLTCPHGMLERCYTELYLRRHPWLRSQIVERMRTQLRASGCDCVFPTQETAVC